VDSATSAVKLFPLPKERHNANLNTATLDRQGVLWCCRRKIEMTPGAQSRDGTPVGEAEASSAVEQPAEE
jgi:streptogramin lyase